MQSPCVPTQKAEMKGKAFFVDLDTFGSLLHYVGTLEHFNSRVVRVLSSCPVSSVPARHC